MADDNTAAAAAAGGAISPLVNREERASAEEENDFVMNNGGIVGKSSPDDNHQYYSPPPTSANQRPTQQFYNNANASHYRGGGGTSFMHPMSDPMMMSGYNSSSGMDKVVTSATVGGVLAITVASAINWLNGGEFNLFSRLPSVEDEVDQELAERGGEEFTSTVRVSSRNNEMLGRHLNEENVTGNLENVRESNDGKVVEHMTELTSEIRALKGDFRDFRNAQEKHLRESSRKEQATLTNDAIAKLRDTANDGAEGDNIKNIHQHLAKIRSDLEAVENTLPSKSKENMNGVSSSTISELEKIISLSTSIRTCIENSFSENFVTNEDVSDYRDGLLDEEQEYMNKVVQQYENDIIKQLNAVVENNEEKKLQDGLPLLYLYVLNLRNNPDVPRYQKIPTNNKTFCNKIEKLDGGKELLFLIGFEDKGNFLEWRGFVDESENCTNISLKEKISEKIISFASQSLKEFKENNSK